MPAVNAGATGKKNKLEQWPATCSTSLHPEIFRNIKVNFSGRPLANPAGLSFR
jgi:hypothetical protein